MRTPSSSPRRPAVLSVLTHRAGRLVRGLCRARPLVWIGGFALLPLVACGGGSGATGSPPLNPTSCTIPVSLTVFNGELLTIDFTHVFVNGDTSTFLTFGPGGIPPGGWQTVQLLVIADQFVALDAHLSDGVTVIPPGNFQFVSCGEGLSVWL